MNGNYFQPTVGEIYHNRNGTDYMCLSMESEEASAMFISSGGWKLLAHGCRQYKDGTIDWDRSEGKGFQYQQPFMSPEKAKKIRQFMRENGYVHYIYGIRTITGAVKDECLYFKNDSEYNDKVHEIFCDGWNNQIYAIHLR